MNFSVELTMLVWSSLLGIVHLLVVAQFSRQQYGLKWIGSARDDPRPAMTGVGGRMERAYRNFLETFPYFIAAVVVVTATGGSDRVSEWGAIAYFTGRLLYIPLYAAGLPVVRGLVHSDARHSCDVCDATAGRRLSYSNSTIT